MLRSSMRSSSGSSLFTSLSMLLILKIIKVFKKYYQSIVVMWQHMFSVPVMRTVWRRELWIKLMNQNARWNSEKKKTLRVSTILSAHHQEFSTVHSALVSFMQVFDDRFQAQSGWNCSAWKRSSYNCMKLTSAECTVENSWWWADRMVETRKVFLSHCFTVHFDSLILFTPTHESSSRLHTVRITGILNICCHITTMDW